MSLKGIHSYSASSMNNIDNFQHINYSFTRHCKDRCFEEAVRKIDIERSLNCPCNSYVKADSVTYLIYQSIKTYFSALEDLSDDKIIAINTDAFKSGLASGEFAGIHIGSEHADAYSRIAALLIKASTRQYRNSRVKEVISESNEPLLLLINKFRFILTNNLITAIDFRKEKLFITYTEFKNQKNIKFFEKSRMTEDYYKQIADIDAIENHIRQYSTALAMIASAHQKMYESKNLSGKETTRQMQQYAVVLDGLWFSLNHLE